MTGSCSDLRVRRGCCGRLSIEATQSSPLGSPPGYRACCPRKECRSLFVRCRSAPTRMQTFAHRDRRTYHPPLSICLIGQAIACVRRCHVVSRLRAAPVPAVLGGGNCHPLPAGDGRRGRSPGTMPARLPADPAGMREGGLRRQHGGARRPMRVRQRLRAARQNVRAPGRSQMRPQRGAARPPLHLCGRLRPAGRRLRCRAATMRRPRSAAGQAMRLRAGLRPPRQHLRCRPAVRRQRSAPGQAVRLRAGLRPARRCLHRRVATMRRLRGAAGQAMWLRGGLRAPARRQLPPGDRLQGPLRGRARRPMRVRGRLRAPGRHVREGRGAAAGRTADTRRTRPSAAAWLATRRRRCATGTATESECHGFRAGPAARGFQVAGRPAERGAQGTGARRQVGRRLRRRRSLEDHQRRSRRHPGCQDQARLSRRLGR